MAAVFGRRPDLIGHRGLGRGEVAGLHENTVASLLAAVAAGVDWVELDVSRSGDGVLVVHHNPATPNGAFLVDRTAAELASHGVAPLAEVLDALPPDLPLDLDLKPVLEDALAGADATVALLVPVLRRELSRRRLFVTSFDLAALLWLRDEVRGTPIGVLSWVDFPLRAAVTMAARWQAEVLAVHHRSFGPNPVERGPVHRSPERSVEVAHDAGLELLAWCPGPDEVAGLVAAGVDAVTVDDVPRLLPLVRSAAGAPAAPSG
jgi:glycerophosphoryl diester phosphodiesterase